MAGGLILKDMTATPALGVSKQATWDIRGQRAEARARCAWLLGLEVAERAVEGASFARMYATPGKVGRGSDNRTALARKLACYLASTVGDCDAGTVARAARLNRKTVHSHLRDVEDLREDPAMDQQIEDMGRRMVGAAASLVLASMGDAA